MHLSKQFNQHKIVLKTPGEYFWDYQLYYSGIKKHFLNYFIIPELKDRNALRNEFDNYRKSILFFSTEMQDQLMYEYRHLKKVYF